MRGHKLFDIEWVKSLSKIGKVDLISIQDEWYDNVPKDIKVNLYNPDKNMISRRFFQSIFCMNRLMKHLDLYSHVYCFKMMKFVREIEKKEHYDFLVFPTVDCLAFPFFYYLLTDNTKKIFIIEHMLSAYERPIPRRFFDIYKNQVNHIIMEKNAIDLWQKKYNIPIGCLHYIPHPANNVKCDILKRPYYYQVVGISNSNDDEYIKLIIEFEEKKHWFKKMNIHALLRSKTYTFNDGWLEVFRGNVNLSLEEFYTHIHRAKVIILPFSKSFGMRSSGTIIDALSNRIPLVGTPFSALLAYSNEYPQTCHIYYSIDGLISLVASLLSQEKETVLQAKEFDCFFQERTGDGYLHFLKEVFI